MTRVVGRVVVVGGVNSEGIYNEFSKTLAVFMSVTSGTIV